ncbi:uncharacterized protein K441DRAFT_87022 [Cenococcum geophilum 1.58]|uniref:uncharacterized protein n=1 Tax=Cenococcum geophilum 1.58 TaxID=794803 RepID=UPI00358DF5E0|nr:hypothetical protein K441DRAFT_87022 [Cenococcum geophilum 1.58]
MLHERSAEEIIDSQLDIRTLLKFAKSQTVKAQSNPKSVIYLHILYDQTRHSINIYVGQALAIKKRITQRSNCLAAARLNRKGRKWTKETKSKHIKFWKSPGVADFWLIINEFNRAAYKSNGGDEDKHRKTATDCSRLLSFAELYAMHLFRTLTTAILRAYLPRNTNISPYPWAGLNV